MVAGALACSVIVPTADIAVSEVLNNTANKPDFHTFIYPPIQLMCLMNCPCVTATVTLDIGSVITGCTCLCNTKCIVTAS